MSRETEVREQIIKSLRESSIENFRESLKRWGDFFRQDDVFHKYIEGERFKIVIWCEETINWLEELETKK